MLERNDPSESWVAYCKLCEYIQGIDPGRWPYHFEAFINALNEGETPNMSLVIAKKLFVQSPHNPDMMVADDIS